MRAIKSYESKLFFDFDELETYLDNLGKDNEILIESARVVGRIYIKNRISEELYDSLGEYAKDFYFCINDRLGLNWTSDYEINVNAVKKKHPWIGNPYDFHHGEDFFPHAGEDAFDFDSDDLLGGEGNNKTVKDYGNPFRFIRHNFIFNGVPISHEGRVVYRLEYTYYWLTNK